MKKIITAAAALALITPTASFAAGILNFPTFDFEYVKQAEKSVQPVTKLNIQTASETMTNPVEANDQK